MLLVVGVLFVWLVHHHLIITTHHQPISIVQNHTMDIVADVVQCEFVLKYGAIVQENHYIVVECANHQNCMIRTENNLSNVVSHIKFTIRQAQVVVSMSEHKQAQKKDKCQFHKCLLLGYRQQKQYPLCTNKKTINIHMNDHQRQVRKEEIMFPHVRFWEGDTKPVRTKAHSIKINRSKLPPDFFPHSDSIKKNINSQNTEESTYQRDNSLKVRSERLYNSPEKTSFFGFLQPKNNSHHAYLKANQFLNGELNEEQNQSPKKEGRKFQSRGQPKRQKIMFQQRKFTPIARCQRNEIEVSTKKVKEEKISPRKEHMSKYKEIQQTIPPTSGNKLNLIPANEDIFNITFLNANSTSFPPIKSNQN